MKKKATKTVKERVEKEQIEGREKRRIMEFGDWLFACWHYGKRMHHQKDKGGKLKGKGMLENKNTPRNLKIEK